jgi:mRNA-degrading endonuclease RelE of RelBE toxin-antitoxin system
MRVEFSPRFVRDLAKAPTPVQRAFRKQLATLLDHGPAYPSLDVHPWPAHGRDAKQARVNRAWRFYYFQDGDKYVMYLIQAHPKSTQRGR